MPKELPPPPPPRLPRDRSPPAAAGESVAGVAAEAFGGLGESLSVQGDRVLLKVFEEAKVDEILDLVRDRKGRLVSLSPRTETLEDIFVDTVTRT